MTIERTFRCLTVALLLLLFLSTHPFFLCAQVAVKPAEEANVAPSASSIQSNSPRSDLPAFTLQFEAKGTIAGVTASPAVILPVQCSDDGSALLNMLAPPEFRDHVLYLVHGKTGIQISLADLPKLTSMQLIDVFVSHSLVVALVDSPKGLKDSNDGKSWRQFIAKFEVNGNYKELVELPMDYQIFRVAILPSDDLVVYGFDAVSNVPRLTVLDSSGAFKHTIELPSMAQEQANKQPRKEIEGVPPTVSDAMAGSMALGRAQFTASPGGVLLWEPGQQTVLELAGAGVGREIQVQSPVGYALDSFIPSNDRWLVQFRRKGLPESAAVDAKPESGNFVIYDVNPSDGSLRRLLKINGAGDFIACAQDGVLRTFRTDESQHLIAVEASLGR